MFQYTGKAKVSMPVGLKRHMKVDSVIGRTVTVTVDRTLKGKYWKYMESSL